jgi:hypothetical protein
MPIREEFAPELMVMSAWMHGAGPHGTRVLAALLRVMESAEPDLAARRVDQTLVLLPERERQRLEAMMTMGTHEFTSDFAGRYYRQGEADGEINGTRRTLLAVLIAREIEVPDRADTRITRCGDLRELESWVRRAATADSIEDVIDAV